MARTPLLTLRVDDATKEVWSRAAAKDGVALSAWIRDAANERLERRSIRLPEAPVRGEVRTDFKAGR